MSPSVIAVATKKTVNSKTQLSYCVNDRSLHCVFHSPLRHVYMWAGDLYHGKLKVRDPSNKKY